MTLLQDIENWWTVARPRNKARRVLAGAQRELAEAEAECAELVRFDSLVKTLTYADRLIESRGRVARLKKLIEQCESYLLDK